MYVITIVGHIINAFLMKVVCCRNLDLVLHLTYIRHKIMMLCNTYIYIYMTRSSLDET